MRQEKLKRLALPPLGDPRYLQLAVLSGYAIAAREVFHMDRSHWITLSLCITAVVVDVLLGILRYRTIRFPVSALIIALACSVLVDGRTVLPYFLAVIFAITSKAFITHEGKHYFNPSNFGVVAALMLVPQSVTGIPALFGGYALPSIIFAAIGIFVVIYAKQSAVSFAWLAGFVFFGLARTAVTDEHVLAALLPALSPAFLLFTFHMISDPATTPNTTRSQIAFGLAVAFLDSVFRALQIPYGTFYALFIVTGALPWIRWLEARSAPEAFAQAQA